MRNLKSFLPIALFLALPVIAQDDEQTPERLSPADLAAASEVIVLAQLIYVDYERPRDSPVEGIARFDVLLPYKVPHPVNRLTVFEEGVKDIECYFPEEPAAGEQRRYLLFLVPDPDKDERYRGNPHGCALEVLTTRENHYAVRWPQDTVVLDDEAEALVRELDFYGPGSRIDATTMTSTSIERRAENDAMKQVEGHLVYTRGILLGEFRRLMGEAGVTPDRIQREGMD